MRRNRVITPALLLTLLGAAACNDVAEPKPLQVDITAQPTTGTVGQTIAFEATAEGFEIIQITVDLGDGEDESFEFPAFTTASANFTHAYAEPGAFRVIATVRDLGGATRTDSVVVTIQ